MTQGAQVTSCALCVAQPLMAGPTDYSNVGTTLRPYSVGDIVQAGLGAASIASLGVSSVFGSGAQATTSLYRAVGAAELESISSLGAFTNPIGIENKYFSTTLQGAQSYGAQAAAAFGEGPYAIVQSKIPSSLITNEMRVPNGVDRGIPTIVVPTEMLPQLAKPVVVP